MALWIDKMEDVFWNSFYSEVLKLCIPVYRLVLSKGFFWFIAIIIQEQQATGLDYLNMWYSAPFVKLKYYHQLIYIKALHPKEF